MDTTFEALELRSELVEALARHGITEPSPIQKEAIPAIMNGTDLLAQSQTGTGKTLAYLLPILQRIDPDVKELQAVVLAPTRELGVQIAHEIEKYGTAAGIRGQALIGGASVSRQIEKLRLHPHIIVGTPGRVSELIGMRKVKMHRVRTIVVDEADQMFALGGVKDVEHVLESALRDRQLLFFSATLPNDVRKMAGRWMTSPLEIEIAPDQKTAGGIEHLVFVCEERDKLDVLRRLVRLYNPKAALAFVNDLDIIAQVQSKLQHAGLSVEALYGDAPKQERTTLLNRFRNGKIQTLIATDVAARGLDIEGLTHVFHLEPAIDAEHYVHRAGRTGRMGRSGSSVSVVTEKELFIIKKFEKQLGIVIQPKAMFHGKIIEPREARGGSGQPVSVKEGHPRAPSAAPSAAPSSGSRTTANVAKRSDDRTRPVTKTKTGAEDEAKPAARNRDRDRDRDKDRKNKGAPRWLKEKREGRPDS